MTPPDPAAPAGRAASPWLARLPLLLALIVALPAVGAEFTNDDDILIVNNPWLLEEGRLFETLTTDYFHRPGGGSIGYWRPLTKLSFALERRLFGDEPLGYHLVSVAWLLLAVGAAQGLARALGLAPRWAALAAVFFALHPAHAEATSIVTARSDMAATACLLLSFWAYARWRLGGATALAFLAALFQLLALGHKETGVLAPVLFLAWELAGNAGTAEGETESSRGLGQPAPWLFFLPVILYLGIRVALGIFPQTGGEDEAGFALTPTLAAAGKLATGGLLRSFLPASWMPWLDQNRPDLGASGWLWWLGAALLAAASSIVLGLRRRSLVPALALVWAPLLLVIAGQSAVHVSLDPRALILADRWLALPVLGAGLLWATAGVRLESYRALFGHLAFVGLLLLSLHAGSWSLRENASFRTEAERMRFVGAALEAKASRSPREEEQLEWSRAVASFEARDYEDAAARYATLVERNAEDFNLRYALAQTRFLAGDTTGALPQAWIALYGESPDQTERFEPNDSLYRSRPERAALIGLILERLGDRQGARRHFHAALEWNPAQRHARDGLDRLGP